MTTKKLYTVIIFSENRRSFEPDNDYLYTPTAEHRDSVRLSVRYQGHP